MKDSNSNSNAGSTRLVQCTTTERLQHSNDIRVDKIV